MSSPKIILRKKQFFKTKTCPWFHKDRCDRGSSCQFAHSRQELQEAPDLAKTSICPQIKKNGACTDGKCTYAHKLKELRHTHDMYKTSLCVRFQKGRCSAGEHCRHAHGKQELQKAGGDLKNDTHTVVPNNDSSQPSKGQINRVRTSKPHNLAHPKPLSQSYSSELSTVCSEDMRPEKQSSVESCWTTTPPASICDGKDAAKMKDAVKPLSNDFRAQKVQNKRNLRYILGSSSMVDVCSPVYRGIFEESMEENAPRSEEKASDKAMKSLNMSKSVELIGNNSIKEGMCGLEHHYKAQLADNVTFPPFKHSPVTFSEELVDPVSQKFRLCSKKSFSSGNLLKSYYPSEQHRFSEQYNLFFPSSLPMDMCAGDFVENYNDVCSNEHPVLIPPASFVGSSSDLLSSSICLKMLHEQLGSGGLDKCSLLGNDIAHTPRLMDKHLSLDSSEASNMHLDTLRDSISSLGVCDKVEFSSMCSAPHSETAACETYNGDSPSPAIESPEYTPNDEEGVADGGLFTTLLSSGFGDGEELVIDTSTKLEDDIALKFMPAGKMKNPADCPYSYVYPMLEGCVDEFLNIGSSSCILDPPQPNTHGLGLVSSYDRREGAEFYHNEGGNGLPIAKDESRDSFLRRQHYDALCNRTDNRLSSSCIPNVVIAKEGVGFDADMLMHHRHPVKGGLIGLSEAPNGGYFSYGLAEVENGSGALFMDGKMVSLGPSPIRGLKSKTLDTEAGGYPFLDPLYYRGEFAQFHGANPQSNNAASLHRSAPRRSGNNEKSTLLGMPLCGGSFNNEGFLLYHPHGGISSEDTSISCHHQGMMAQEREGGANDGARLAGLQDLKLMGGGIYDDSCNVQEEGIALSTPQKSLQDYKGKNLWTRRDLSSSKGAYYPWLRGIGSEDGFINGAASHMVNNLSSAAGVSGLMDTRGVSPELDWVYGVPPPGSTAEKRSWIDSRGLPSSLPGSSSLDLSKDMASHEWLSYTQEEDSTLDAGNHWMDQNIPRVKLYGGNRANSSASLPCQDAWSEGISQRNSNDTSIRRETHYLGNQRGVSVYNNVHSASLELSQKSENHRKIASSFMGMCEPEREGSSLVDVGCFGLLQHTEKEGDVDSNASSKTVPNSLMEEFGVLERAREDNREDGDLNLPPICVTSTADSCDIDRNTAATSKALLELCYNSSRDGNMPRSNQRLFGGNADTPPLSFLEALCRESFQSSLNGAHQPSYTQKHVNLDREESSMPSLLGVSSDVRVCRGKSCSPVSPSGWEMLSKTQKEDDFGVCAAKKSPFSFNMGSQASISSVDPLSALKGLAVNGVSGAAEVSACVKSSTQSLGDLQMLNLKSDGFKDDEHQLLHEGPQNAILELLDH